MKTLFRNNYFQIELYYKGVVVGVVFDDDDSNLNIVLPFIIFRVKTYMFSRKPKPKNFNSRVGYDL